MLELAGGPAVSEGHQHSRRAALVGEGPQHVPGAGEADGVAHPQGRMPVARRAVQHEAAVGLHRAAGIHRQVGEVGLLEGDRCAREGGQAHLGGPIDDDPHRAVFVVLGEVRVRVKLGSAMAGMAIRK